MLNQYLVVGRLTNGPSEIIAESGKKVYNFCLAVPRNYKNDDGVYETDFLTFTAFAPLATQILEYCRQGDLIGLKGRLEIHQAVTTPIVEKVTFLSSRAPLTEEHSDGAIDIDTSDEI